MSGATIRSSWWLAALGLTALPLALGVGWHLARPSAATSEASAPSAATSGARSAEYLAPLGAAPADGRAPLADASDDPAATLAALAAIEAAYVARAPGDDPFPPELDREVLRQLGAEHPAVVAKALVAARVPMLAGRPSEELVAIVSGLATAAQPPERRQAALEALSSLRPSQRTPAWLELFEATLRAPEPQLVATALESLLGSPRVWQDRAELRARWSPILTALAGHSDPGIRGRALAVLALLDGGAASTRARARAALRDPHPYVRAVGCDVLGQTDEAAYVHDLIPLVGDLAEARYDLGGWTRLDGQPGSLPHAVPGRPHVAEAALYAVETLADGAIRLPFGGREGAAERLQLSIRSAQQWYGQERSRLPSPLP